MNVVIRYIERKLYTALIFLIIMPMSAFCASDFEVVYQVDDQIISNYDIDQAKKLRSLLTNSNLSKSEVEKIVVNEKIKEIFASRLNIVALDAELKAQLGDFLKSNKKYLAPLRYYISPKYDTKINKKLSTKRMLTSITSIKTEIPFHTSLFDYSPIPGPFLKNLKNTKNLLESYDLNVF